MTAVNAITAASLTGSLGVNTHLDSGAFGYQNLSTVEAAIRYLGVTNIRDSASSPADAQAWQQVAQATGAKFDAFIGEGSPAQMQTDLGFLPQLAQEGILSTVEGGNEEDNSSPQSQGNNLQITAQFQQQLYAMGQSLGLPVVNMSFGAGWTAANNWQGDYGAVGDLSAYANYANAHAYPMPGQTTDSTLQRINGDALLAAGSRQVIVTEMGWDTGTFDQRAAAQYVVQAAPRLRPPPAEARPALRARQAPPIRRTRLRAVRRTRPPRPRRLRQRPQLPASRSVPLTQTPSRTSATRRLPPLPATT